MIDGVVTIPVPGLPLGAIADASSPKKRPAVLSGFVIGPENQLVEPVVAAIVESPPDGQALPSYNPLYVYGPSGSGKSHLLRGLAGVWKGLGRGPVVYVAADDFARQLTDAYETHGIEEFRTKYRRGSLVAVDDVGRLAGKAAAQEELAATLDELLAAGRRLLVSGSVAAQQLPDFSPRLTSRLISGMNLPLALPERASRRVLLEQLAALRGIALAARLLDRLADELVGGPRELSGALLQLETTAKLTGQTVTVEHVERYLALRVKPRLPQIKEIASLAAHHFRLRLSELRSPSRRQAVVTARGVAIYLARQLTHESLEQIGQYFGGRDHTTVLHGCRKIEELVKCDPAVLQAIQAVQQALQDAER